MRGARRSWRAARLSMVEQTKRSRIAEGEGRHLPAAEICRQPNLSEEVNAVSSDLSKQQWLQLKAIQICTVERHPIHLNPSRVPPNPTPLLLRLLPDDGEETDRWQSQRDLHRQLLLFDEVLVRSSSHRGHSRVSRCANCASATRCFFCDDPTWSARQERSRARGNSPWYSAMQCQTQT